MLIELIKVIGAFIIIAYSCVTFGVLLSGNIIGLYMTVPVFIGVLAAVAYCSAKAKRNA